MLNNICRMFGNQFHVVVQILQQNGAENMWEALFDKECLLKAMQQNGLTSEFFLRILLSILVVTRIYRRSSLFSWKITFPKHLAPSLMFFWILLLLWKKLLLSAVSLSQLKSEFAWTVVGWLSVTILLRTVSLPDSIFVRLFFTVCLISADMLNGPFAPWILSLSFVTDTGLLNTDCINILHLLIASMFTGFANDFSCSWSTLLFSSFCVRLIKPSAAIFNDPHFALICYEVWSF